MPPAPLSWYFIKLQKFEEIYYLIFSFIFEAKIGYFLIFKSNNFLDTLPKHGRMKQGSYQLQKFTWLVEYANDRLGSEIVNIHHKEYIRTDTKI